ncbi:MAG: trehalase family glycosidase [bacterium]
MHSEKDLIAGAKEVLEMNDRGNYTQPAHGLYPHQWLWDSCFIAIGLRHLDTDRAQTELISLIRGQWHNGMLPNIIFREDAKYRADRNTWQSWLSPYSPDDVTTTGITQPPMLAEAVLQVGKKLPWPERRSWYSKMLPVIVGYHEWLFKERDPHNEGLVLQIHPWETGLDNTPPWMQQLNDHLLPFWIRSLRTVKLDHLIGMFRRDAQSVPMDERFSVIESIAMFDIQLRFKRKAHDIDKILDHAMFAIEDLNFNSIFIRANSCLVEIAKSIKIDLPESLLINMKKCEEALEQLWDPYSGQYYSRDFITHKLLKTPSIATLLPLYGGSISKERADQLVKLLDERGAFAANYPIPSVPLGSPHFDPKAYWQGPTWVNTNWLVIKGLENYGYHDKAKALAQSTIKLVEKSGFNEYFDPNNGEPYGADNFSWTAALAIDLDKNYS